MAYRNLYSETHVTDLLEQILSAVDYLHGRRIVHLDLKSDNMLVTGRNVVKIVDLGSAQPFTPGHALNIEHIKEMTDNKGKYVSRNCHFALIQSLYTTVQRFWGGKIF